MVALTDGQQIEPGPSSRIVALLEAASEDPEYRARLAESGPKFVRSQTQLALTSDQATGRRMTALETYDVYGAAALREVVEDGAATLIQAPNEPAATLKARRKVLNLTREDLSQRTGLALDLIEKAEKPGNLSSIRDLERIAQALALDDYRLGTPGASGDAALAAALNEMANPGHRNHLSRHDLMAVAGAAWVIARQSDLTRRINEHTRSNMLPIDTKAVTGSGQETGFWMADKLRELLELGKYDPIIFLLLTIEERLGVPVVSERLDESIAVIALRNGQHRGLVINERGANRNVFMWRVALAHGLGHLLGDTNRRIVVDKFTDLELNYAAADNADPSESRASAFALAFLAPGPGLRTTVGNVTDRSRVLAIVMMRYGISARTAMHHIQAAVGIRVPEYKVSDVPWWEDHARGVNRSRPNGTPMARQGRFSSVVAKAHELGLISTDSAAANLACSADDYRAWLRATD
jgi:transcriptional regulator with XRE-family HTH domain/Zn-dependent peptidase ImmA (M78 family)